MKDDEPLAWVLLIEPAGRSGADNMAVDQALVDDLTQRDDATAYLRLYRWDPACLSFGRNEPAFARYDRQQIDALGFDVVRRPTGGRAVWHQHEVTYAVAAPVAAFGSLRQSYWAIHQRLAQALQLLGMPATLASPAPAGSLGAGACFARSVGGEVLVRGKKVIGSAQVRDGRAFLQHGSILLAGSQDPVHRVSRGHRPANRAATLSELAGQPVTFHQVTSAIRETWLEPGEQWSTSAPAPALALAPSRFSDPAWTWRR